LRSPGASLVVRAAPGPSDGNDALFRDALRALQGTRGCELSPICATLLVRIRSRIGPRRPFASFDGMKQDDTDANVISAASRIRQNASGERRRSLWSLLSCPRRWFKDPAPGSKIRRCKNERHSGRLPRHCRSLADHHGRRLRRPLPASFVVHSRRSRHHCASGMSANAEGL